MKRLTGIETRHSRSCAAYADKTKRCSRGCEPRYRATLRVDAQLHRSESYLNPDEAVTWRANRTKKVRQGKTLRKSNATTLRMMVEEFMAELESGKARSKRRTPYKPKTVRMYIWSLRSHVLPTEMADMRMTAIGRKHIMRWLADMEFADGPSQVNNALNPLRVVFQRALDREVIEADPMASVRSLPEESRTPTIIDATEAEARLSVLTEYDRAIWAFVFYAGLRIGEVRALERQSIDLDAGVVRVTGSFDDLEGTQTTKTKAGIREVPLIFPLRRILTSYRASIPGSDTGPLFPGQRGGQSFNPSHLRLRSYKAWKDAPEPFERLCPHEGRHVFASWAHRVGRRNVLREPLHGPLEHPDYGAGLRPPGPRAHRPQHGPS